jgi:hypothetical protein
LKKLRTEDRQEEKKMVLRCYYDFAQPKETEVLVKLFMSNIVIYKDVVKVVGRTGSKHEVTENVETSYLNDPSVIFELYF